VYKAATGASQFGCCKTLHMLCSSTTKAQQEQQPGAAHHQALMQTFQQI
jgi:hypothetical protein